MHGTMSEVTPYATINAFNWLAALGATGNRWSRACAVWYHLADSWAFCNILLVTLGLAYLAVCSSRSGRFSPLLLAAYYGLGIFTLAPTACMSGTWCPVYC